MDTINTIVRENKFSNKRKDKSFKNLKTKHLSIILLMMFCVSFILVFSSSMFKLKEVKFVFYDTNNDLLNIQNNKVFSSNQALQEVIKKSDFDFNKSMFMLNKEKYKVALEKNNPYIKILNIETIFPNLLKIHAQERTAAFSIENYVGKKLGLLVDEDFKILNTNTNFIEYQNKNNILIPINFFLTSGSEKSDFFKFFNISPKAYESGQFLTENNLVFTNIKNFPIIVGRDFFSSILEFNILLSKQEILDFKIVTNNKAGYGVKILVEDIMQNFDKKMNKIKEAFITLSKKEKIKLTYGTLQIDKNCNVFWKNL